MASTKHPHAEPAPLAAEFEALYAEHFTLVWRALRVFGVPAESLEDAAQDVFVIVHRRFGAWAEGSLRGWLWGVARRVAAARRRSSSRHRRKLEALPRPEVVRSFETRADARHRVVDQLQPSFVAKSRQGLRGECFPACTSGFSASRGNASLRTWRHAAIRPQKSAAPDSRCDPHARLRRRPHSHRR